MIDYSISAAIGRLVARCEPDLAPQAQALLERFASFSSPTPHEGMIVEFGWSPLTVRRVGHDFYICEPDFDGNPFAESRPSVDTTLRVLASQVQLLERHALHGAPPRFSQKVLVARGVLDQPELVLERETPDRPDDSGWSIQGSLSAGQTEWEATYVYKLAVSHPWIAASLALPAPVRCVLSNHRVKSISPRPHRSPSVTNYDDRN